MPNHVINRISAHSAVLQAVLNEKQEVDFNTIIPMPESLQGITHDSETETAINIIFGIKPSENELLSNMQMFNRLRPVKECKPLIDVKSSESWDRLLTACQNMRDHGFWSWYEWSVENWGTKWNAYDTKKPEESGDFIEFQTAWNPPYKFFENLSKKFQTKPIMVETSDEDSGSQCNIIIYENGVEKSRQELEGADAVKHYFKLWQGTENPTAEELKDRGYNQNFEYVGDEE